MTANGQSIAIRADAAHWIGSGHIARCTALADELRQGGANVHFICREAPGDYSHWLEQQGYTVHRLSRVEQIQPATATNNPPHLSWLGVPLTQEIEECASVLAKHAPFDWLIVDHYALERAWETAMASHARQILVIDDLADRPHHCQLLLDQNLQSAPNRYAALTTGDCRRLLGPSFALLRPEFRAQRSHLLPRSGHLGRLLIFMGGNDAPNITLLALQAVATLFPESTPEIDVVIGLGNPHREVIAKQCAARPGTRLHVQTHEMARLMAQADLMIGAAGTTSWERCCLGLPAITVSVASNQRENGMLTARQRVALYLGDAATVTGEHWSAAIRGLADHPRLLRRMSARALALTDGQGCMRLALIMNLSQLDLRRMQPEDCEQIWYWRNDQRTRRTAFDPAEIPLEAHRNWFEQTLGNPERALLMGCIGRQGIGVLRFDRRCDGWEISVYLDPDLLGLGLGSQLIQAGTRWLEKHRANPGKVVARIRPENRVSKNAFLRAGFMPENSDILSWQPEAAKTPT